MPTTDAYRLAFDRWRDCVEEYENPVNALLDLSDQRGQGDRSLPLIVRQSDSELVAAVQRELDARAATDEARRRLDRPCPPLKLLK